MIAAELSGVNLGDQITFTAELATITGRIETIQHCSYSTLGNQVQLTVKGDPGMRWIGHIKADTPVLIEQRLRDGGQS